MSCQNKQHRKQHKTYTWLLHYFSKKLFLCPFSVFAWSIAYFLADGQVAGIQYTALWQEYLFILYITFFSPKVLEWKHPNVLDSKGKYYQFLFLLQPRSLPWQSSDSTIKKRGPPQRQINISVSKDVELLHKAEDAWKPSHKDRKETAGEEDAETEVTKQNSESGVNWLTSCTIASMFCDFN